MSGIVGILHLSGAPADAQRLQAATDFLRLRGPDAQRVWVCGPVGLGHAALHTTAESPHWPQPLALDDQLFLTGDVRLDVIAELKSKLLGKGHDVPAGADDSLLVLHAYRQWGAECLQHLAGDFCFAIWDARDRSLFCARDQIGIKPFFYAVKQDTFFFSNTLNCLRLWPAISDELNDSAVADYLMTGWLQNPEDTFFADIKRLPAAHSLVVSRLGMRARKYWMPPLEPRRSRRRAGDYVEEFTHLLSESVAERLRTGKVAVLMSGGLDSSSVSALARDRLRPAGGELHAFTVGYERLFHDVEPRWARRVAEALEIPFHYLCGDDHLLFAGCGRAGLPSPEPDLDPVKQFTFDLLCAAACHSRVALTGEGGDIILGPPTVGNGFGWRQLPGAIRYIVSRGRVPRIGLRTALRRWRGSLAREYPAWLNQDLERRFDLPARWRQLLQPRPKLHPTRPHFYNALTANLWPLSFEILDPGFTAMPLQLRHPWLSLRLVEFAFTIPVQLENFADKGMVRAAMRGILPEEVRRRPKSPLPANPVALKLQTGQWHPVCDQDSSPVLWNYLKAGTPARFSDRPEAPPAGWDRVPLVSFNCWLQSGWRRPK